MPDYAREAGANFNRGFNCYQSVISALTGGYDPTVVKNLLRLGSVYGGGVAREGNVCGALLAIVGYVGLKYGTDSPKPEDRQRANELAGKLFERFEAKFGYVNCRDLTGCVLSTPEGRTKFAQVHKTTCPPIVTGSVEILQKFLSELEET